MKKKLKRTAILMMATMILTACGGGQTEDTTKESVEVTEKINIEEATEIVLSDDSITVAGEEISEADTEAVYKANDIVYYEAGHDFTYGEGTEEEAHTADEAKAHTVVHITEPGMYSVSGQLSKGQIAVDLGEDAEDDPGAVVTLVMNGADINCDVAPAVIFYNVYECGSTEEADATNTVDTMKAGANVYVLNGTENNIAGSHVARIYESYELNDEGTEVVDSKKLHKYDAAFYSKMTMNVDGAENTTGTLNINADNEGLDSELHLTINGGNINIASGNDGINTNEDGISVTTVNGGNLTIKVTGETGEGDGIDSNGWLVINGGTIIAEACSSNMDGGIDSDMGIHINGGNVYATGNMLDSISESKQNFAVMNFAQSQQAGASYELKNENNDVAVSYTPENNFSIMIISTADMVEGTYTFWKGETQLAGMAGQMGGMMRPGNMEMLEGMEMPEGFDPSQKPENGEMPEGMTPPQGGFGGFGGKGQMNVELSKEFAITAEGNYYNNVKEAND